MADVIAPNGRLALIETAGKVLRGGELVSPRGKQTKEIRHFTIQITNPYDTLCTGINANYNTEVAAAEAIQLIGGFSDPDFAVKHVPNLADFRNSTTGNFDGAYGPRIEVLMQFIIKRLQDDPDTRQAILPIWQPQDVKRVASKDFPCTLTLGFFIRNDRLELDVVMRSNDVCWGLKYDMTQFTQLQLSIAGVLGIEAGPYRHTAFSMHLYERDWEWAERLLGGNAAIQPLVNHPTGISGKTTDEMMQRARAIAFGRYLQDETISETWYKEVLGAVA